MPDNMGNKKYCIPWGQKVLTYDFQNYSSLGKEKTLNKLKMLLVFGQMFAIWNLKEFLTRAKWWILHFWQMMKSKSSSSWGGAMFHLTAIICAKTLGWTSRFWQWKTLAADASHAIGCYEKALSANDDNRIIQPDKIQTLAHGHFRTEAQDGLTREPTRRQRASTRWQGNRQDDRGGLARDKGAGDMRGRGTWGGQGKTGAQWIKPLYFPPHEKRLGYA